MPWTSGVQDQEPPQQQMWDGQRRTEIGQFGDVLANLIVQ
jgi:hypothetical protein